MATPEMDMMAPGGADPAAAAPAGPLAQVDDLVAAVLTAKGADPAMVTSLPPLDDTMVQGDPALAGMLEALGLGAAPDEAALFDEAEAADPMAAPSMGGRR